MKAQSVIDQLNGFLRGLSKDGALPTDRIQSIYKEASGASNGFNRPTLTSSFQAISDGFRNILETLQGGNRPPDAAQVVRANSMTSKPSGPGTPGNTGIVPPWLR